MHPIKSAKDIEAAVKAQAILHKPDSLNELEAFWKQRVAEITKGFVTWSAKERMQLSQFQKACTQGKARDVLSYVLQDWIAFGKNVQELAGAKSFPTHPQIGFLLLHRSTAVNLWSKSQAVKKQEAPKPLFVDKPVQLTSTAPKPVQLKPTYEEAWKLWSDDDEDA